MSQRLSDVTISKPFVYGNVTIVIPEEERLNVNTHRWIVYVRGPNNEDLSTFIKEVHFQLHESFDDPIRIIRNSPYEVSEVGWGEFTIQIKIHFHAEAEEPPVSLLHPLKYVKHEASVLTGNSFQSQQFMFTEFKTP